MNGKFNAQGNKYILKEKSTKMPLYNFHFNRGYYMTFANDMSGEMLGLEPIQKVYNRNFRYCIINDGEDIWSVGGAGEQSAIVEDFSCEYGLYSTKLNAAKNSLAVSVEAFVPMEKCGEFLLYRVRNIGESTKKLTMIVVYSLEDGPMGAKCRAFQEGKMIASEVIPYHIYYDDFAKIKEKNNVCFSVTSKGPDRVCCSEYALFDGARHNIKNTVKAKNYPISYNGKPVAAFIYEITLSKGEEVEFWTFTSYAKSYEEAEEISNKLLFDLDIGKKELELVKGYYEQVFAEKLTKSGDVNLDNFASYWAKKQVLVMAQTKRFSKSYSVRNSLQDALGFSYIDEKGAWEYFREIIALQKQDGSIRQHGVWNNAYPPTGLALLYMRDGPSWLLLCVANYLQKTKNYALLEEEIPYMDGGKGSVYEHLIKTIHFMWGDRGMFGLSLLGDGDWTDPINGPGRKGKGVSTWTSMAFVYGLKLFSEILGEIERVEFLPKIKEMVITMEENILKSCWKDDRFIAGYTDDGEPYGCNDDQEGNLFLNMQSWAIISGVAKGEVAQKCVKNIYSLLTPVGVSVMSPAFTNWNEKFGKISVKRAGTTENGSVYCHASMFASYALFMMDERETAEEILRNVLPTHEHQADFDIQAPIFIPNYYFGLQGTPQFGRSSGVVYTGSSDWFLKIYNEFYGK